MMFTCISYIYMYAETYLAKRPIARMGWCGMCTD